MQEYFCSSTFPFEVIPARARLPGMFYPQGRVNLEILRIPGAGRWHRCPHAVRGSGSRGAVTEQGFHVLLNCDCVGTPGLNFWLNIFGSILPKVIQGAPSKNQVLFGRRLQLSMCDRFCLCCPENKKRLSLWKRSRDASVNAVEFGQTGLQSVLGGQELFLQISSRSWLWEIWEKFGRNSPLRGFGAAGVRPQAWHR